MTVETVVDVAFPLTGGVIPLDHGYLLYGAVSSLIPSLHEAQEAPTTARASWGLHPIKGVRGGPGELRLDGQSLLKVRLPANDIARVLPLAGKSLRLGAHTVTTSVPRVYALEPRAALKARFVTIRNHETSSEDFALAVRAQLAGLEGLGMDQERLRVEVGPRRVLTIAKKKVVGFHVAIEGLNAQASLALQAQGLGGRRHMGAGIFVPWGRRA